MEIRSLFVEMVCFKSGFKLGLKMGSLMQRSNACLYQFNWTLTAYIQYNSIVLFRFWMEKTKKKYTTPIFWSE